MMSAPIAAMAGGARKLLAAGLEKGAGQFVVGAEPDACENA